TGLTKEPGRVVRSEQPRGAEADPETPPGATPGRPPSLPDRCGRKRGASGGTAIAVRFPLRTTAGLRHPQVDKPRHEAEGTAAQAGASTFPPDLGAGLAARPDRDPGWSPCPKPLPQTRMTASTAPRATSPARSP